MCVLLDTHSELIDPVLKILLQDKTTGKNIIWATNSYIHYGVGYSERNHMEFKQITGFYSKDLLPRVEKAKHDQAARTKGKAEVFTPSWICNKMNNYCDEDWFGRPNVFNKEDGQTWIPTEEKIAFPEGKTWKQYIDSRRLEITCGEAPFIASRYDAATGDIIPLKARIGILDRKMRILNENAEDANTWFKWAIRAFQSVYGYEFQGDNLLIARINMLNTFIDYVNDRWGRNPTKIELRTIANVVVWNFWQMDGLKNTIPFGSLRGANEGEQTTLFGETKNKNDEIQYCRIFDWRADRSITYNSIKEGKPS